MSRIFVSIGFPEPADSRLGSTARRLSINEAVRELARVVMTRSATEVLVARDQASSRDLLEQVARAHAGAARLQLVSASATELGDEFRAAVFIGGGEAAQVDWQQLRSRRRDLLLLPVASTGGAAGELVESPDWTERLPAGWDEREIERWLRDDFIYGALFDRLLYGRGPRSLPPAPSVADLPLILGGESGRYSLQREKQRAPTAREVVALDGLPPRSCRLPESFADLATRLLERVRDRRDAGSPGSSGRHRTPCTASQESLRKIAKRLARRLESFRPGMKVLSLTLYGSALFAGRAPRDVDLLVETSAGESRHLVHGKVDLSIYPPDAIDRQHAAGSLYLWTLKQSGARPIPLHASSCLGRQLDSLRLAPSYDELRETAALIGWLLLAPDAHCHDHQLLLRTLSWTVRTLAIIEAVSRDQETSSFQPHELAARLHHDATRSLLDLAQSSARLLPQHLRMLRRFLTLFGCPRPEDWKGKSLQELLASPLPPGVHGRAALLAHNRCC